jgi:hypothetical protein
MIDCRPRRLRRAEFLQSPSSSSADGARRDSEPGDQCARRSGVSGARLGAAAREAALVAIALLAYFGVRLLSRDQGAEALANAAEMLRLESALGLARELSLQHALLDHVPLVRLLNWVYVWGYWPVLAASLCYLYMRRRQVYRRLRSGLVLSGVIGLIIFMGFPVAPPRLTPMGVVDTMRRYDPGYQEVAHPSRFTNQYAAMPSFHFGWSLLCGVCVAKTLRSRGLKALMLSMPLIMGLAIIVTGNHYIADALVGGALSLLGLALCELLPRARRGAATGKAEFGDG